MGNSKSRSRRLRAGKLLLAAAALAVVTAFFSWGISQADEYSCPSGTTYTVVSGDTLWSVVQAHCTGDIPAAVHSLVKAHGATIRPGMVITFP